MSVITQTPLYKSPQASIYLFEDSAAERKLYRARQSTQRKQRTQIFVGKKQGEWPQSFSDEFEVHVLMFISIRKVRRSTIEV